MREVTISIQKAMVAGAVYRLTANAEVERNDNAHVATDDNRSFVFAVIDDATHLLSDAVMRYGYATATADDVNIVIYMPANWGGEVGALENAIRVFVENYAIAKWFELSGSAENYNLAQVAALQSVKNILEKRNKPTR